ncbi:site-specific integrase [Pectobacterium brasiliense]|uniref:site-specific integrase n=1 Tax=Pectobacterium brasiliense TaxID=180957 RepID=UPI00301A5D09
MSSSKNTLMSDVGVSMYSSDLTKAILELNIPERIYLKTAMEFDDRYIINAGNKWEFYYAGSRRYLLFKQDDVSNKLIKYICFKYASTRFPTRLPTLYLGWKHTIEHCCEHAKFSFATLRSFLEKDDIDSGVFYSVLFGLKILCAETFPGFTIDNYEDLEFIPRPHSNSWGIYQEIDNVLDPLEKNMISKSLFEMGSDIRDGKLYQLKALLNAAILGLTYVTGARPVQLAKLAVRDFRIDTHSLDTGLIRYSILLPYAKQRHVTTERLFLAIPPEIGGLILHYIERSQLAPDDKLFEMGYSAPKFVSNAINCSILSFSPPDYQAAVTRGEAAESIITPTDLRHNVGHSLAMQGASAEEIAHILGHSSLVAAKHYILATPSLALIRAKALGVNPVWQNMVAMMLTGKLTSAQEWQGYRVTGVIGDQLHYDIGGCSRIDGKCPFCEVRCCYGCLYYRPFTDGDHQAVLDSVIKEVDELTTISDSVGNARNPLISIHETTQFEIQSVIARCRFHLKKEVHDEKTL